MKLNNLFRCLFIKCVLVILSLKFTETKAKTFSINEAIKAGLDLEESPTNTVKRHYTETTPKTTLSKKLRINSITPKDSADSENRLFHRRLSSPLQNIKQYYVRSPLKPKRIKNLLLPRNKNRNQARKRDTRKNEDFSHKYIPLLNNLNMLINNLLTSKSSETSEEDRKYQEQIGHVSDEKSNSICRCEQKRSRDGGNFEKDETSVVAAATFAPKISEIQAASSTTHHATVSDLGNNRQNKKLSVLFTRNTTGSGRNYTRYGKRNRASFHRSVERNSAGNNGNNEYSTEQERNDFDSESDEQDSNSTARNNAISSRTDQLRRRERTHNENKKNREETKENYDSEPTADYSNEYTRRDIKLEGENKPETEGNETKDSRSVPFYSGGKTFAVSVEGDLHYAKSFETSEERRQDDFSKFVASNKRIYNGSSSTASKNKTFHKSNQRMILPKNITTLSSGLDEHWIHRNGIEKNNLELFKIKSNADSSTSNSDVQGRHITDFVDRNAEKNNSFETLKKEVQPNYPPYYVDNKHMYHKKGLITPENTTSHTSNQDVIWSDDVTNSSFTSDNWNNTFKKQEDILPLQENLDKTSIIEDPIPAPVFVQEETIISKEDEILKTSEISHEIGIALDNKKIYKSNRGTITFVNLSDTPSESNDNFKSTMAIITNDRFKKGEILEKDQAKNENTKPAPVYFQKENISLDIKNPSTESYNHTMQRNLQQDNVFTTKINTIKDPKPAPVYVWGETFTSDQQSQIRSAFEHPEKSWHSDFSTLNNSDEEIISGTDSKTKPKHNKDFITSDNISNPPVLLRNNWNNTMVTIFDGYSVTKGKKGQKRLAEESIFIYP